MTKHDDDWTRLVIKVHPDHWLDVTKWLSESPHIRRSRGWVMPSWLWRRVLDLGLENPKRTARQVLQGWVVNRERRIAGEVGGPRLAIEAPEGLGDRLQEMAEVTEAGSVSALACRILEEELVRFEAEKAAA